MKSKKNPQNLDRMCESTMVYLEGQEVTARLDWDRKWFYVWLEPSVIWEDWCESNGMNEMLTDLENDLARIGVEQFHDLYYVNEFLKTLCGDSNPAVFYIDDALGIICGG